MDQISNIQIGRDITNVDLNTLNKSYHEGIYSFNKEDCILNNNYPAENMAGFLIIQTDFEDSLIIQKITTFDNSFYFRTGTKNNGIFTWSDWDQYASINDIPAGSVAELENKYVKKEEFYPKGNFPFVNEITHSLPINRLKELDNIVTEHFRFLGTYYDDYLTEITDKFPNVYINNEGLGEYSHRNFLLGYWVKEEATNFSEEELKARRQPSNKPGILHVYSSFNSTRVYNDFFGKITRSDFERYGMGNIQSAWIFFEFDTGNIYVTNTLNRVYFNPNEERDISTSIPWVWSRYSFDATESYNLNKASGEHSLKLEDILDLSKNLFVRERNRKFLSYNFYHFDLLRRNQVDGNYIRAVWDNIGNTSSVRITSQDTSITEDPESHTVISWLYPNGNAYNVISDKFLRDYDRVAETLPNAATTGTRFAQPIFNSFQLSYGRDRLSRKEE